MKEYIKLINAIDKVSTASAELRSLKEQFIARLIKEAKVKYPQYEVVYMTGKKFVHTKS